MPIKIVSASEVIRIEQIILCIYALPGIGKTTLGQSADDPLTLDFDRGIHRAKNRRDAIAVGSWKDIEDLQQEDLAPYKTLVIDTAGRLVDALKLDVIRENPNRGKGGDLDIKGWGIVKRRFVDWSMQVRSWGIDIVLISHMEETRDGDVTRERLDIAGGAKGEIYKTADAMARLFVDGRFRKLDFSPREGSLGKNPTQLEVLTVPSWQQNPNYLGEVIRQIKTGINSQNAEQTESAKALAGWHAKFAALDTLADFNEMLKLVSPESPEVKFALIRRASQFNLVLNKVTKTFEEAQND